MTLHDLMDLKTFVNSGLFRTLVHSSKAGCRTMAARHPPVLSCMDGTFLSAISSTSISTNSDLPFKSELSKQAELC